MKPNYNTIITSPPLEPVKIDTNTVSFNLGKDKENRIGASQMGGVKLMGRLYVTQLNNLRHVQELDPASIPGFSAHIGGLAKIMGCTRKTVQNRLDHYEKCGVIIKRENNGKYGIRIWFHPDIIFKNQDGYAHFTGSEKTYTTDHTQPPITSIDSTSTTETAQKTAKVTIKSVQKSREKNDSQTIVENPKSVKFTHNSSRTTGTVNTNTMVVDKLTTTKSNQLEGVPPEQSVLPVPSSVGKGEDTGTPTGTRESCPKKNKKQGKVAPIRAPKSAISEPPISEKNGTGGAGRAFLLDRVQGFWDYAKKKLFPGVILLECEERRILNYIWASVFLKFPPGYSEDAWWKFYQRACKRVDIAGDWLELNPAFDLPDPKWYFNPKNTRGVNFYITEDWLRMDERKSLINKIKWEVNDYSKGKGRFRHKTPLELFRRHERMVAVRKDAELSAMFSNMKGTLYGRLKVKEKFF